MTLGLLVRSTENSLGIGKIQAVNQSDATIEYFLSPGQHISQTLPLASLRRLKLQRQTRCYLYSEEKETWQVGRIYAWDEEREQYQVDLPNCNTIYASESQIYVRCNRPIEDPVDILAMKGQQSPYLHYKRFQFFKTIIEQRAISRGMTGLLSANIELFPHQVEVIRRVLEDPIQRYLLADEVGLGKTIEAGVILRQFLLDESPKKALILVPPYLYYQWKFELEHKFYLSHFPDRVKFISTEELQTLDKLKDSYHFLIIDEAHHIAAMAISNDLEKRHYFETCRNLAHQAEKLLLLSATPVLNHEQEFLAMLHLLDPVTYQLDDLNGFRERVQKRQEIGRVLLAFKEGIHPFVLKKSISNLKNLFTEDKTLLLLIDELQTEIQNQDKDSINQKILGIRTHISDTYRLHRRRLRNRRATVEDVIFDRNAVPKLEYDLDERLESLQELLDEWRIVAPEEANYQQIFTLLFCASNTWLGILKQVVKVRLKGILKTSVIEEASIPIYLKDDLAINQDFDKNMFIHDFGINQAKILAETPPFNGELNILSSILQILQNPSQEGDRLELLKLIILYDLADILQLQSFKNNLEVLEERVQKRIERSFVDDRFPKIVIFTSFTETCKVIANYLTEIFGQKVVVSHQVGDSKEVIEAKFNEFKNNTQCFILVTDSSGEEGKNLQFVDRVIHFDLPVSPNRLEQRLGRVDRIGGKLQVDSWLLAASDLTNSFSEAWYQLFHDGFNIFNQSIASLQFYIDAKLPKIEEILFKSGATGIKESISQIQAEIEQENLKISEQNALDEIDSRSEIAKDYFERLEEYDAQHKNIEKAVEGWLCNALNFQLQYDPNLYSVRTYKATQKTLISPEELQVYFGSYLKKQGVYNRRLANKYGDGIHLYRIGEELIDTLANYLNWNDMGKAFAMWRKEPSWDSSEGCEWLGFRFDYIIEIDWEKIGSTLNCSQLSVKAFKRQCDALFSPRFETVFLNSSFEQVEDEKLLEILQRPYNKHTEQCDYNLAKNRLGILEEFIDPSQWSTFCYEARKKSETLLRQSSNFIEICQKQTDRAKEKLSNRCKQLELRYHRYPHSQLGEELQLEKEFAKTFLKAINYPDFRLDAVGFIIISGRSPVC